MRAKSIKNKARVNAELSPAELKILLKKAQRDHANAGNYIALLEQEVGVWRAGGSVDQDKWASMEKALGLAPGELAKIAPAPSSSNSLGPTTKMAGEAASGGRRTPAFDRLSDGEASRPLSPSGVEESEREEWLRRENDLQDQLAKAVSETGCVRRDGRSRRLTRIAHRNRNNSPLINLSASCAKRLPR